MIKRCVICGKAFDSKGYSKYCSPECRVKGAWAKRKQVYIKKVCPVCGKEFLANRADNIYCSNKCVQKNFQAKRRVVKHFKKICPVCGKEFITSNNTVKYCSDDCRNVIYKDYQKIYRENIKRRKLRREHNLPEKEKCICLECGKEFFKSRSSQKYCSYECKEKHNYKTRNMPKNKICGICGKSFQPSNYYKYYCSDECKVKASELKAERNRVKNLERSRKKASIDREKRSKLNERKRNGNEVLNKINTIAKETGLSYGEVKKWYPDMDKIKFMANYLGRKGMDANEPRIVGRTSMLIV